MEPKPILRISASQKLAGEYDDEGLAIEVATERAYEFLFEQLAGEVDVELDDGNQNTADQNLYGRFRVWGKLTPHHKEILEQANRILEADLEESRQAWRKLSLSPIAAEGIR